MSRIAIIGAGISGLSAGQLLKEKHEVELFERAAKPGGLVKCDRIDGNLFHRVGGHVFNSRNPQVLDWFWKFFDRDTEFLKAKRNAKILLNGKLVGYPLENYLWQLPKDLVSQVLDDFLSTDYQPKQPFEYADFATFLESNFGKTLYQLYFKPYNEKIWNRDLAEIPLHWLEGKLPMPDLKAMLLSNIVVQEETEMVHSTFFYAKTNGSQFIVDRLAEGLTIHKDFEVEQIEKQADGYYLNQQGPFHSVVFTGDVRRLGKLLKGVQVPVLNAEPVTSLPSNGTSNLFCETDPGDISWLYLPDPDVKAHRIIYTGTFAPSNNGGTSRQTCVVEFSGLYSYEFMCSEIRKLPGNLKPLAWNQEPNSYIVHQPGTAAHIRTVKQALEQENLHLLGRFAEWEYYNMDKAIEAAMELAGKLK